MTTTVGRRELIAALGAQIARMLNLEVPPTLLE
jgi:hypothetical protein